MFYQNHNLKRLIISPNGNTKTNKNIHFYLRLWWKRTQVAIPQDTPTRGKCSLPDPIYRSKIVCARKRVSFPREQAPEWNKQNRRRDWARINDDGVAAVDKLVAQASKTPLGMNSNGKISQKQSDTVSNIWPSQ